MKETYELKQGRATGSLRAVVRRPSARRSSPTKRDVKGPVGPVQDASALKVAPSEGEDFGSVMSLLLKLKQVRKRIANSKRRMALRCSRPLSSRENRYFPPFSRAPRVCTNWLPIEPREQTIIVKGESKPKWRIRRRLRSPRNVIQPLRQPRGMRADFHGPPRPARHED